VGILLLRARKDQGWRMTRGRKRERKKRGITMKQRETEYNDTGKREKNLSCLCADECPLIQKEFRS